jgi:hypothetical protein
MEHVNNLSPRKFANLFIERITELVRQRPAYLTLLSAPVQLRRDPTAKRALRVMIANAFRAKNPSLSDKHSVLAARVSLQIARGMMTLYGEAEPKDKDLVVNEFKKVLTLYLATCLKTGPKQSKGTLV